jgi:hypothetical protein
MLFEPPDITGGFVFVRHARVDLAGIQELFPIF